LTVTGHPEPGGFCLVGALGHFRARRDPDAAVLHGNAVPVLARVIEAMDTAPSLPSGVHGLGLDTSPSTRSSTAFTIQQPRTTLAQLRLG
jgi:hypothetical protein